MKIWKKCVLFYLGGCAYMGTELLWRRWSHGSMFLAGGLCFLLIGHLRDVKPSLPLPWQAVTGAGIITMVELAAGLLVNQNYQVWDYRKQAGNFLGQICPIYCLLWIPVALAALELYNAADKEIDRLRKMAN